jgi:hypothetical protein
LSLSVVTTTQNGRWWSGLPLSNIKLIRRRFDSWRFAPTDVEQCPADMYHTTFYAIDLQ